MGCQQQASETQTANGVDTSEGRDIFGVWWVTRYDGAIRPQNGELPFTETGRTRFEANRAGLANGTIPDQARTLCVPDGMPRILASPYPFQIIPEMQGQITIVYEVNHVFRIVQMDTPEPPLADLEGYIAYMGHSFGHWEGNELVVRTMGFKDRSFIDVTGVPHGYGLIATERYRAINDGGQLQIDVTVEDPEFFTEPWQSRFVYDRRPDVRVDEDYVCGEPHRDLSSVEGIPR